MIMVVKKNIEEGGINPTCMDIDHLMLMKINVKMATIDAKAKLPSVKIPSFNGDSDPNVYLDWEAKCEQIF